MKKILSIFMTLMVLGSAAFAFENDPVKTASPLGVAVVKVGSTFKVFYKGSKQGDVMVKIYNQAHQVVLKDNIQKVESFMRPYNFSSLPEGEYVIEVTDEIGRKIEKINYSHTRYTRLGKLIKMPAAQNKYALLIANKGSDVLNVRIIDGENRIVYNAFEEVNGDFARIYDLKELKGNFLVEVTDKSGTTVAIPH